MAFNLQLPLSGGGDALEDACIAEGERDFGIISRLGDGEVQMGFDWRVVGCCFFQYRMHQFWVLSVDRILLCR